MMACFVIFCKLHYLPKTLSLLVVIKNNSHSREERTDVCIMVVQAVAVGMRSVDRACAQFDSRQRLDSTILNANVPKCPSLNVHYSQMRYDRNTTSFFILWSPSC